MGQLSARGRTVRIAASALLVGATLLTGAPPVQASAAPSSVTIGVDHVDLINSQPQLGRLFEYTDFFTREVTVHQGEVVNFQTAPFAFHVIALARDEGAARHVYPFVFNDKSDPNAPSGAPKVGFGSSNFPITGGSTTNPLAGAIDYTRPNGPPVCGATGEANCVFTGGSDVEVAGVNINPGPTPTPADWRVQINAAPGTYHFFCYVHPNMTGTLHVSANKPATTQAQINKASVDQFQSDRGAARSVEAEANHVTFSGGAPGSRTYWVKVGLSAANDHVAIDEMFPNPATIKGGLPVIAKGDKVAYLWRDDHNVHTVFFPALPPPSSVDVPPIGFDCDSGYVPAGNGPPPCAETGEIGPSNPPFNPGFELIGDPGNAAAGTLLTSQSQVVDSGVRVGAGYGLHPSSQSWSVRTDATTASGQPYLFHCTIHDFMVGGFIVNP